MKGDETKSEPNKDASNEAKSARTARNGNRVVTVVLLAALVMPAAAVVFGAPVMYETFKMPSGSMEPTLYPGDVFFARRAVPQHDYGRAVVFPMPDSGQLMVKRVLARGGDRVVFASTGEVTINGWPIPRCLVGKASIAHADGDADESAGAGAGMGATTTKGAVYVEHLGGFAYLVLEAEGAPSFDGAFEVAPRQVFVVGDNRRNSHDSRTYNAGAGGGIAESTVRANPFRVWRSGAPSATGLAWRTTTTPWLPPAWIDLRAGLDRCLAAAPPRAATIPPPPTPLPPAASAKP